VSAAYGDVCVGADVCAQTYPHRSPRICLRSIVLARANCHTTPVSARVRARVLTPDAGQELLPLFGAHANESSLSGRECHVPATGVSQLIALHRAQALINEQRRRACRVVLLLL
jgi:hypothetical protein